MNFKWNDIFLKDLDWSFGAEIVVRTLIMFVMILVVLRLSGKKGVRQLSLFELAIIIGLGSAAGDPMFNKDVPILPALIVFVVILIFYRLLTWLSVKYEWFESLLEGDPLYIIEDGMFVLKSENGHTFAKDEFLAEMRQQSIEHLGQVKTAILETNGVVSFYYYGDNEVKAGLPMMPKLYNKKNKHIAIPGIYACTYCGCVKHLSASAQCTRCHKCEEWVPAIKTLRIT